MEHWQGIITIIGTIVGILLGGYALVRSSTAQVREGRAAEKVRKLEAQANTEAAAKKAIVIELMPEQLEKMGEQIESILKQMSADSGMTIRDALDRLEIEVALNRERGYILAALDIGAFEADEKGLVCWASPKLQEITGYTEAELKEMGWLNFVAAEERERVRDEYIAAFTDARSVKVTFKAAPKNNKLMAARLTTHPMKDDDGNILRYMGIVTPAKVNGTG